MEEKKEAHTTESTTTDAHPQVKLMDKEPIAVAMEHSPEPVATHIAAPARRSWKFTAVAVVLVVVALLAVLFRLEKEGRVETNLFSGIIASQEANAKVAVVNGEALRKTDLTVSADQLAQAATAQVDHCACKHQHCAHKHLFCLGRFAHNAFDLFLIGLGNFLTVLRPHQHRCIFK